MVKTWHRNLTGWLSEVFNKDILIYKSSITPPRQKVKRSIAYSTDPYFKCVF